MQSVRNIRSRISDITRKHKQSLQHKTMCRGFTLVEMMVAMSLFIMVVGISVGSLMVLLDANERAQQKQEAVTNVSFILDSMSREIRTGLYYDARSNPTSSKNDTTHNCPGGCSAISFIEAGGSLTESCQSGGGGRIGYRLNGTAIQRRLCGGGWDDMTAPNVKVDDFTVSVKGADSSDDLSPIVTLFVRAHVEGVNGVDEEFMLQTSLAQQAIDI